MEPGELTRGELYGDLLHAAGVEYEIAIGVRTGRGEAVVAGLGRTERGFSERDRDVLDIARPELEGALRATQARGRLVRALADDPPPGTAVMLLDRDGEIELSSPDAGRWLAEHFGAAEHPGWLPRPVAEWLALPPRPPLVSERDGRRLTVCLVPGDPHALLLEEAVASFRPDALDRLGLTARESEVLRAAAVIEGEAELAWELFLSLHAVRERLARLEAKLGVRTRRRCRRPGAPREPVEPVQEYATRCPAPSAVPRSPQCSRTARWRAAASRPRCSKVAHRRRSTLPPTTGARVATASRAGSRADDPRCTRSCIASGIAQFRPRGVVLRAQEGRLGCGAGPPIVDQGFVVGPDRCAGGRIIVPMGSDATASDERRAAEVTG